MPISDAAQRARLRADYYLRDTSLEYPMYCVDQDPVALGIDPKNVYARSSGETHRWCFEIPEP